MKFQFYIKLTDADYMEFNKFHMLNSPYGKKQLKSFRISISIIFLIFVFIALVVEKFKAEAFISIIPFLVFWIVTQLCLRPFMTFSIKSTLKTLKKSGKAGYSPNAVLKFYDESFIETTETNKTEQTYTSIEQICIVNNKMIYIYINNVMAYILPLASFESQVQYNLFLEFIKTKCDIISFY